MDHTRIAQLEKEVRNTQLSYNLSSAPILPQHSIYSSLIIQSIIECTYIELLGEYWFPWYYILLVLKVKESNITQLHVTGRSY